MNMIARPPVAAGMQITPVAPSLEILNGPVVPRLVQVGDLMLDMLRHTAYKGRERLKMTNKRFLVLTYIAAHMNESKPVSRDGICMWLKGNEQLKSHAMEMTICHLRSELRRVKSIVEIPLKKNFEYRLKIAEPDAQA